jgi:hypothetical protein
MASSSSDAREASSSSEGRDDSGVSNSSRARFEEGCGEVLGVRERVDAGGEENRKRRGEELLGVFDVD